MEEVLLAIFCGDEAEAAIGDDLLDGAGGHDDLLRRPGNRTSGPFPRGRRHHTRRCPPERARLDHTTPLPPGSTRDASITEPSCPPGRQRRHRRDRRLARSATHERARSMSAHRFVFPLATAVAGLVLGSALGAGIVLAQTPGAAKTALNTPAPFGSAAPAGVDVGAPAVAPAPNVVGTGASGSGGSSSAIAYPYWAGSPGLAPDHTIVVTGTGQAELKTDGSNQEAAQATAIAAAIADAKSQADAVATATGLTITSVLSVAVSASPYGVVEPMAAPAGSAPGAPVPAPGNMGS